MRRREISPEYWSDGRVWKLESDAHRLLLPGLWAIADREGRMKDEPFDIGIRIRPWAPHEVDELLRDLEDVGLVIRYAVAGERFICLPPAAWKKHQRPHPREKPSTIPPPPKADQPGGNPGSAPRQKRDRPNRAGSSGSSGSSGPSGPSGSSGSSGPSRGEPRIDPQEQLIEVPAEVKKRETSLGEDYHHFFVEKRALKFTALGVEFVPDDASNPAFVNAAFKRIDAQCEDSDVVCDLINEYFSQDWPAKYEPPYPFSAFTSGKVWPKLLQQVRGAA